MPTAQKIAVFATFLMLSGCAAAPPLVVDHGGVGSQNHAIVKPFKRAVIYAVDGRPLRKFCGGKTKNDRGCTILLAPGLHRFTVAYVFPHPLHLGPITIRRHGHAAYKTIVQFPVKTGQTYLITVLGDTSTDSAVYRVAYADATLTKHPWIALRPLRVVLPRLKGP